MKSSTIHHLNSALIIISCIVAFYIPFELFLFSYGILGPLHYLTEIGWLHKKNYFTKGKYDFIFLVVACVILVYWNYNPPKNYGLTADIILYSLLSCIAFVFIKDWLYRFVIFALALIFVGFLNNSPLFFTWVAVFLPTIIHVFIFTWAFMLYGVLKEKSLAGLISILILIACSVIIITIQPANLFYPVSEYAQKSYTQFGELNYRLINFFNLDQLTSIKQIFTTNAGFVIMRFIAFAYTYHYLNWFSKTSVIKWHLVPKKILIGTIAAWLISISLYIYDYNLGLQVLFFLSFLHVFLEFPLNIVSFTGIGKELAALGKNKT
ncbi:MAG: hypothetical protein Q7W45_17980 [Bacteroidota bacterium]|nr:hypothetical protein [Bacteroidota bacterium]MDP3146359.1 hypothetical protein [Bacteroidota bacterium]MDP3556349.1 hypothetical protein [Bacteroidota bacterium]